MSKRAEQTTDMERFKLKKLNKGQVKEQYQVTIRNNFATHEDINHVWDSIRENINFSAKKGFGYREWKYHKTRFDEECSKLLNRRMQAKP
jgi:hypothetical protein